MIIDHPLVFAHRGASAREPDNTLGAFSRAVFDDADGIELDVRRTSDGFLVISHDPTLPDGTVIVEMSMQELRDAAPHIPTLDEMLDVSGDLFVNFEIKNMPGEPDFDEENRVAATLSEWIAGRHLHRRAVVTSFNPVTTAAVRGHDPDIVTGQLTGKVPSLLDAVLEVAAGGHTWIVPHYSQLDEDPAVGIAIAHEHGLKTMVWTLDDPERMRVLADANIDGIITNDPGLATEALTER